MPMTVDGKRGTLMKNRNKCQMNFQKIYNECCLVIPKKMRLRD